MLFSKISISEGEKLARLRLIRSENVGPRTFQKLLARYGSAQSALDALPALAAKGGAKRPIKVCPLDLAKREMAACQNMGITLLHWGQPDYPALLNAVEDAPPVLQVMGNVSLLQKPMVGMVGARNASLNGRNMARRLAFELGNAGYGVVSGLARGIDTSCHEGSLATGTIAVMAGGLDVIYPPENKALYADVVKMGVAVSEMPPHTQPQASHFPRRNRIIAGLSLGTIVVEASLKSGSLITARLAGEMGREVFAVPGHPIDPRASGPNQLIKDGAILTEGSGDILTVLDALCRRPLSERGNQVFTAVAEPEMAEDVVQEARLRIQQALGATPVTVDLLIRECQLSASVVSLVLLELELAGRLERSSGNQVSLLTM